MRQNACGTVKVVVVAVKVFNEIPRTAIVWALTHLLQPGDSLEFLVIIPTGSSGKNLWGFSRFANICGIGDRRSVLGTNLDWRNHVSDSCSSMIQNLSDAHNLERIRIKINIIFESSLGIVAAEAKRANASWIVLEKHLKQEAKICMVELQSNIVIVNGYLARFLRLNLLGYPNMESKLSVSEQSETDQLDAVRGPATNPACSPDHGSAEVGTSSISSSEPGASPFFLPTERGSNGFSLGKSTEYHNILYEPDVYKQKLHVFQTWMADSVEGGLRFVHILRNKLQNLQHRSRSLASVDLGNEPSPYHQQSEKGVPDRGVVHHLDRSLREVISVSRYATPVPHLCSICRHKTPEFGKPPRLFSYTELDIATCGFSNDNFLAEGGFGSVHRGVLEDGQAIAVKQHKLASSQGDLEFCSEVEVLCCAHHRNVVTLLGLCLENGRRMLVYEYICNGSLDSHLYGCNKNHLEWSSRKKIAIGLARGLRYLHEECRVGCIVHRDLRPNNILLTHDLEPLVGDFGLARWQPDGNKGVETRVLGRFGYLAPEYAQSGQITEKADVYSFGVVLLELITGRKAMDIKRPKGQHCLTEWARPLVEINAIDELTDPNLRNEFHEKEINSTLHCAYLCIQRDPHFRPRMSQVLHMLEEDIIMKLDNNSSNLGFRFGKPYSRMKQKQPQPRLDGWPSYRSGTA